MFFLPNDAWEVRKTKTTGRGIFASKEIAPGTVIGDYIGKVIRTADENDFDDTENFYLMYYHDKASIFPDLKKIGIHLLNHSCTPNVWMYTYHGHTLFFALRHIFPGEELTVSYLLSPQKECKECTHFCICRGAICHGTMHMADKPYEDWWEFHAEEAAKTKRARVRYGQVLPGLKTYPDSIPDNAIYPLFGASDQKAILRSDKTLPEMKEIRKQIREIGKYLEFPKLKQRIIGVTGKSIYSEEF